MKSLRSLARTIAFKIIYQRGSIGKQPESEEEMLQPLEKSASSLQLAKAIIDEAWNRRRAIEASLDAISTQKKKRLRTLNALMTLAAAELLYFPNTPPKVVINEYIEICRAYCPEISTGYCNSMLDKLMKSQRAGVA